ncbi:hypothetical protein NKH18_37160 [Streptomyces sp. M10(2022)]
MTGRAGREGPDSSWTTGDGPDRPPGRHSFRTLVLYGADGLSCAVGADDITALPELGLALLRTGGPDVLGAEPCPSRSATTSRPGRMCVSPRTAGGRHASSGRPRPRTPRAAAVTTWAPRWNLPSARTAVTR